MAIKRQIHDGKTVFFYAKIYTKGVTNMFSDETLEKIFEDPEAQKVPIGFQSTMIHVIEKILEEESNADEF